MRIGVGYDIHRLVPGSGVVLGGVEIKCDLRLDGHSDADVLVHAVMDALLGAAGLADIGNYFPNTDEKYKGISSIKLLEEVVKIITDKGFSVVNVDCALIAERPKISPFVAEMKSVLSKKLNVNEDCVGIKATTNEGVGSIGAGEAIAVHSVALLK